MRKEMREQVALEEEKQARLSARNEYADRMVEKWSRKKGLGEGLSEMDTKTGRGLALVLENQENHLSSLTETQISNAFSTTPENVLRVVRLGYPNSVRGELFYEWAMETARDSVYYLSAVYGSTKRDATADAVMHESGAFRYPSEVEYDTIGTGDGSTTSFSVTLTLKPVRPYSAILYVNNVPVASDDGAGNIVGSVLNSSASNTINYTTGEVVLNFTTAPANAYAVVLATNIDTEVSALYPQIGNVELQLRDYQFRVKPFPLYVSWSKMTELLLGSTLTIDAEEALIRGAGDELKKSLDFMSVRQAYQASLANTAVTFDIQGAVGESEVDRAMAFSRAIDNAADNIYSALNRGGVSKLVGGPGATSYIKLHKRFSPAGAQPNIGIYKIGSLDGVDIYKAPPSIVPDNEFMTIWRNQDQMEDASLLLGSYVPLYRTQTLEFKEFYKETGMAHFGDSKVVQPKYLQRISLSNL